MASNAKGWRKKSSSFRRALVSRAYYQGKRPWLTRPATLGGEVNDEGVITLPGGKGQVAIAVFIQEKRRAL